MKKQQIKISNGKYRGQEVSGVFTQVDEYIVLPNGAGYLHVDGAPWGRGKARIHCSPTDFEVLGQGPAAATAMPIEEKFVEPQLTDEELMAVIEERFEILDEMTQATINGDVRAMIVQGPPGVGKSHGVGVQLEQAAMFDEIAGRPVKYEIKKGALTALGLYAALYKHSDPGHVLVFDDADGLFSDELSLNLLKAALDSGKRRRICWNADSHMLQREGIPDSFDFKGSVIFITNLDFNNFRSKKITDHLNALQSRCHFVDLAIHSQRGKLLRIKQIINKGMLDDYGFTPEAKQEIVDFVFDNADRFREISLRTVIKVADLRKIMPKTWQKTANITLMKTQAIN